MWGVLPTHLGQKIGGDTVEPRIGAKYKVALLSTFTLRDLVIQVIMRFISV